MSDHTASYIFGTVFEMLAKNPSAEHKRMARKLFIESQQFDFSDDQLHANEALKKLGLARLVRDPDYPDEKYWEYGPKKK